MASRVIEINSDEEIQAPMREAGDQLIVIDFSATWCGPCQTIAPVFAQLSIKYPDAVFLKVDVDKCPVTRGTMQITSMPTFVFMKFPNVLDKFSGADTNRLDDTIARLLAGDGAGGARDDANASGVPGQIILDDVVDLKNIECLNQKEDHSVANLFADSDAFLESDCDEQLIIALNFKTALKIHSLVFTNTVSPDAAPDASGPKTVRLYINQPALDFDDTEKLEAVQTLTLTPEQLSEGAPVELRFVKFQNVSALTLFVENNQGDTETTSLSKLSIIGTTRETTNMADFKRVAGKAGEGE